MADIPSGRGLALTPTYPTSSMRATCATRLLGGLIGVSALQTLITHQAAQAQAIIAAHVTAGTPAVAARLATTTTMLTGQGMEADAASRAALQLLGRAVSGQSAVIAFDAAFVAVALLFVVAAPVIVALKIGIGRAGKARRAAHGATIAPSRVVARP
jgi:DHA2 family multidrug resistance protein